MFGVFSTEVSSVMKTLHDLAADKLEQDPSLLHIPLENIDCWTAQGHGVPHRLEQWRQIILGARKSPENFQALLDLLRDRSETAGRLKDFAPFAGVLTASERQTVIRECVYSH